MADFCKQCSIEVFGEAGQDLAGLLTPEEAAQGMCVSELCEGCGPTRVDIEGNCLEYDCMRHGHGEKHKEWIKATTGRREIQ
jgi:hypothetical protein